MQRATRDTGWFTSSYSGASNGNCVEVRLTWGMACVRDSKNRRGGGIAVPSTSWQGLLAKLA